MTVISGLPNNAKRVRKDTTGGAATLGKSTNMPTNATTPNIATNPKVRRQFNNAAINTPNDTPTTLAIVMPPRTVESAWPRFSYGTIIVTTNNPLGLYTHALPAPKI